MSDEVEELPTRYWESGPNRHGLSVAPQMNGDAERKVETLLVGPDGKTPIVNRVTGPRPMGFQPERLRGDRT